MTASVIHILCVDDEEIPRTLRKLILEKRGYRVFTATSGFEALELLKQESIHLVLSDQMMPGMMGTELAKTLRTEHPHLPMILVSGMNEVPKDAHYADRFVSKIEGPDALFRNIEEVLVRYGY